MEHLLADTLLDAVIFEISLESLFPDENNPPFQYVGLSGTDMHAVSLSCFQPCSFTRVQCDVCGRSVAASRFAVHLERCMGKGRTSRRVISE
ncbi:hypothetical protein P9112_003815 [Eukaryota sp. TZLM1-RC]